MLTGVPGRRLSKDYLGGATGDRSVQKGVSYVYTCTLINRHDNQAYGSSSWWSGKCAGMAGFRNRSARLRSVARSRNGGSRANCRGSGGTSGEQVARSAPTYLPTSSRPSGQCAG